MARSKVGASGTLANHALYSSTIQNDFPVVDKRNHPLEATKFAAKLLRQNYNMLESWPLAVTGYNHGPTGVLKMTRSYETRELGELIQNVRSRKSFGFASEKFLCKFLSGPRGGKKCGEVF